MFHLELRQFPHVACAFNLSEAELWRIVEPWSRAEWIEVGDLKLYEFSELRDRQQTPFVTI